MKQKLKNQFQRKRLLIHDQIIHNKSQLVWWGIVFVGIAVYAAVLFGPIFRLKNVSCVTIPTDSCPDFVVPEINRYKQHHLFTLPTRYIKKRLAANLPQIQTISLVPLWPDELLIELIKYPTTAYLQIPASESAYTVSSEGTIMDLVSNHDQLVPTIIASSAADLIISDQITEPSILFALSIVKQLKPTQFEIEYIDIRSPFDIRVFVKQDVVIAFTTTKPITDQVNALHLITSQTTIDYEGRIIDLRYDRPAIKSMW